MAKKSKKNSNIVTVNFKGVESGGGGAPDEGRYEVEVAEVSREEGKEFDYLAFVYSITGPGKKKGKLYDNCSMSPAALWRLRGVLEALGVDVPDDDLDIDLEDLVGRTMGVEVTHEEYNKKKQARITDVFSVEDVEDADEETPKKKSKKTDDEEEDEAPKKKKRSRDEDDEDDEPKKKKGKKKKASVSADDVLEMDDEALQEAIDEHSLEVDLEEYNTTRRKRAAVIEAMTEAGIIEEEDDE